MLLKLFQIKKILLLLVFIYCLTLFKSKHPIKKPVDKRKMLLNIAMKMMFFNNTIAYHILMLPDLSDCQTEGENMTDQIVVATVLTSANRYETRMAIRESWAGATFSSVVKNRKVLVYFIISDSKIRKDMDSLLEEQAMFNDLIVTDLRESYNNLVYKVHFSITFHLKFCPYAQFLLKIDDDVGIHLDRMKYFMSIGNIQPNSIFCQVWTKSVPKRNNKSKWFLPMNVWPKKYFPKYCNGPVYLVGKEAGERILDKARLHNPFIIEDVFYTGILAEMARVRRHIWSKHILHTDKELWSGKSKCNRWKEPEIFAVHSLKSPDQLRLGFQQLKSLQCSNFY